MNHVDEGVLPGRAFELYDSVRGRQPRPIYISDLPPGWNQREMDHVDSGVLPGMRVSAVRQRTQQPTRPDIYIYLRPADCDGTNESCAGCFGL